MHGQAIGKLSRTYHYMLSKVICFWWTEVNGFPLFPPLGSCYFLSQIKFLLAWHGLHLFNLKTCCLFLLFFLFLNSGQEKLLSWVLTYHISASSTFLWLSNKPLEMGVYNGKCNLTLTGAAPYNNTYLESTKSFAPKGVS